VNDVVGQARYRWQFASRRHSLFGLDPEDGLSSGLHLDALNITPRPVSCELVFGRIPARLHAERLTLRAAGLIDSVDATLNKAAPCENVLLPESIRHLSRMNDLAPQSDQSVHSFIERCLGRQMFRNEVARNASKRINHARL
jgi:hypothetical protein